MPREHVIDPDPIHHQWDNTLEPVLSVGSGDVVHYDLRMAGEGQVEEGCAVEDARFDWDTLYNLSGPVHVEGAQPGDTLEIEVLALEPGDWGWTVILPDMGLLPRDFPMPYLRTFDLRGGERVAVAAGVSVPIAPFLGTMGTHPDQPRTAGPFPPHKGGGNIDTRHLTAGSSLFLPVWCEGALVSCGDPHAAQGDGEVCVSAVECAMRATLRFRLHRRASSAPSFRTAGALTPHVGRRGYHATLGIRPDLMEAARAATRAMIVWLVDEHGLSREDAYILCSLAGDLHVHEVVDAGVWNVGMAMPLDVFAG